MISSAKIATDAGLITICAFKSYTRDEREQVRSRVGPERFLHVYVNTSEDLCRERRPDADFTGFEPPPSPDVTVALDRTSIDDAVELILQALDRRGQFDEV